MGLSIRKSAKIVGINIATSFFWRHKILDCISAFLGTGHVDGVIEADEVFFAESFKGTRTNNMPRKSRKRGKEIKGGERVMKRPCKPPPPSPLSPRPELSDCLTCIHHSIWKYNLIECKYRICPQPNCKDNNITCINHKK